MKKITAGDSASRSPDLIAENLEQMKALFPEAFTEGRVDFDVLKQLLAGTVDEREEKYGLNWHGKRQARQLALAPSTGTLRPCPEDSIDWDTTQHLMIEGDNLEVLKLLQKSYARMVKFIYIDPPYNTGKDFVYPDDYRESVQNYLEITGQIDGESRKLSSNTEASGRFHTDWLNMMYPRLQMARDLLSKDGIIFISIDDIENANLMSICNDIFGATNLVAQLIWKSKSGGANDSQHFAVDHEYIVAYAKSLTDLRLQLDLNAEVSTQYNQRDEHGEYSLDRLDKQSIRYSPSLDYTITGPNGEKYTPAHKDPSQPNASWRWSKKTVSDRYDELVFKGGFVYTKNYRSAGSIPRSLLSDERFGRTRTGKTECRAVMDGQVFDNPKPTKLIRHLLSLASQNSDIVLDFFAGSGTTGHAVMAQNVDDGGCRRYILVQLPEPMSPENREQRSGIDYCDNLGKRRTLAELTKERLRRSGAKIRDENPMFGGDLGFRVFRLDTSNIRAWEPDHDELEATLLDGIEHIRPDRGEGDVLYELLLKLGLDLCVPIETRAIAGKTVRSVGAGTLVACLAESIATDEVEPLGLGIADWHAELEPAGDTTVVFRDSAFADDVTKTNLTAILEQRGLGNVRSL